MSVNFADGSRSCHGFLAISRFQCIFGEDRVVVVLLVVVSVGSLGVNSGSVGRRRVEAGNNCPGLGICIDVDVASKKTGMLICTQTKISEKRTCGKHIEWRQTHIFLSSEVWNGLGCNA